MVFARKNSKTIYMGSKKIEIAKIKDDVQIIGKKIVD